MYSLWSNWQYGNIGSDNGLAPNRRQAKLWSVVGMFYWRIYASFGLNALTWYYTQYCSARERRSLSSSWALLVKLLSSESDWTFNIGSANGLVPWGNKPLSEPVLTHIYGGTRPYALILPLKREKLMSFGNIGMKTTGLRFSVEMS